MDARWGGWRRGLPHLSAVVADDRQLRCLLPSQETRIACHGIRDLSALDDEACVVNGDARDAVVIHRPRVDHNLFARLARVPLASSSAKCRASIPGVST